MPPKRARVEKAKDAVPEAPSPATEERKARADEKKRAAFANRIAMTNGAMMEEKNEESTPSPVRKKSKDDDGEEEEEEDVAAGGASNKFDPMRILAQANIGNIVDLTTPGYIPLDLDSPHFDDSDSIQSLSQLSPGLQLGNLSINNLDSPSSSQAASILHEAGEKAVKEKKDGDYADGLDSLVGSAVVFLKKTDKELRAAEGGGGLKGGRRRKKGEDSLNAPYKRGKSVIGINMLSNALSKSEDLALLERTYSAAELVLLSSPIYQLESVYRKAINTVYTTRLANEKAGVQEAMTINQCLAWLARSASCDVNHLIPNGEYYPDAVDYLTIRLTCQALPLCQKTCAGHDKKKWTAKQVSRCLQMMAVADLRPLPVDDRCILLYAIGMLYIDDSATVSIREAAQKTVRNVLSSCEDQSQLLEPLFNLTPVIVKRPDEASKWILMFKNSGVASAELLISIGASHYVFVCERAECTPDAFHYPTPSATFTSYINVLTETIIDVLAFYNMMPHRRYHRSLVTILNLVLTPTALRECEEKSKRALLKCIEAVIYRMNPDLPDDAIVITELRTLTRRVERVQDGRKGKRTDKEVAAILKDRRLRKKEKAEQLKGGRKKPVIEEEKQKEADISDEEEEGSEGMRERSRLEEQEEEEEEEDEEEEEERAREDVLKSILDAVSTDSEKSEREVDENEEGQERASIFSVSELDEDKVSTGSDPPEENMDDSDEL